MEMNEDAREIEEKAVRYIQDPSGHFSKASSMNACACGRSVNHREDPFDLQNANYRFFERACCNNVLSRYYIPHRSIINGSLMNITVTEQSEKRSAWKNSNESSPNSKLSPSKSKSQSQSPDSRQGQGKALVLSNGGANNMNNNMNRSASGKAWYYEFGFDLLSYGHSEHYHKTRGFQGQPGFENHQCFLTRWDIPVPSSVYTLYFAIRSKGTRYRENCMCCFVNACARYVGFDFEGFVLLFVFFVK